MTVHCKKCNGKSFRDISSLRRHQWAEHAETFNNTLKNLHSQKAIAKAKKTRAASWTKAQHVKYRATIALRRESNIPTVELVKTASSNGEMTVSVLLDKLKTQRDFMSNVVSLIEGLVRG